MTVLADGFMFLDPLCGSKMSSTTRFENVDEEETGTFGIKTKFEITDDMREEADALLHDRDEEGNTATSDRGRDASTQKKHSYIGCLGEVVAARAFENTPIEAIFGGGVDYDVGLTLSDGSDPLELEVKTRHHKEDINHVQRDMFLRKKNPAEMDADMLFSVKVYPNYRGEWEWAEIIGYCTPAHADKWKVERDDISHYTKKWEIKEKYLRDDLDTLGVVVKKWTTE